MYSEEGGVSGRLGVDVAEEDTAHPVIIAVPNKHEAHWHKPASQFLHLDTP